MRFFKQSASSDSQKKVKKKKRLSDLLKYPESLPAASKQTIQDLFFYLMWFLIPIQQAPVFLGIVALLLLLSWSHRFNDAHVTHFREMLPEGGRWFYPVVLWALFLFCTLIWSPLKYITLMCWLYGVWIPVLVLFFLFYFINGVKHWRKALTFFLSYLIFIYSCSMISHGVTPSGVQDRYDWPPYFFTPQASATWLLMIYPLFLGLVWHHDILYQRFAKIGVGIVIFITFILLKLGLWLGLWLCTSAMIGSFYWVGRSHYIYADFMRANGRGFKRALYILGFISAICLFGIYKNHGAEWLVGLKVFRSMPVLPLKVLVGGGGLGQEILEQMFKNVVALPALPWIIGFVFQVGIIGIILSGWLWFLVFMGFIGDLCSEKADRQWIGVLGIGVMVNVIVCSFFSSIELGTIMIPASLSITTLLGLKRYLNLQTK